MSYKKVQLRGGFSDRNKIHPLNAEIQVTNFDARTRNRIANLVGRWCECYSTEDNWELLCENIVSEVFGEFITKSLKEKIHSQNEEFVQSYITKPIIQGEYDDVLTILEYLCLKLDDDKLWFFDTEDYWAERPRQKHFEILNDLFCSEFVGYRMIGSQITPITDEIEVSTIQEGLDVQFSGCRSHLRKSLSLLSDREKPDYKNSIKESISAVESICHIITNNDGATLGQALNQLTKNGVKIHPAMKDAFSKLYGYTSDEKGVRHAEGLYENDVPFEDAKFCLVSCCAFVNYLVSKYGKQNER